MDILGNRSLKETCINGIIILRNSSLGRMLCGAWGWFLFLAELNLKLQYLKLLMLVKMGLMKYCLYYKKPVIPLEKSFFLQKKQQLRDGRAASCWPTCCYFHKHILNEWYRFS